MRSVYTLRWLVACVLGAAWLAAPLPVLASKAKARPAVKPPSQPVQEISLRYRLDGERQATLAALVERFNQDQQGKVRLVLQDLATLDESARQQLPTLALIEPDDSAQFFRTDVHFRPLHQVMAAAGMKLTSGQFFPLMADAVDDGQGRIQALPLGLSLPVLLWNKTALQKVGLDPEALPLNWFDVQQKAGKLFDAGSSCPLTSSRFSWIHLENVSAQHGEPLVVKNGRQTQARLNSMVDVKHLALLSSWYKARYFRYFGPGDEADSRFLSGECAMITAESALYRVAVRQGLSVGISQMPYYDDAYGANREQVLPGGLGLWVLAGHGKRAETAVAQFVSFMMRNDVQEKWLQGTGFLPMTPFALNAMKTYGAPVPLVALAVRRLSQHSPAQQRIKHNSGLAQLRGILGEEVATVWANVKPAKEALDVAMMRAAMGQAAGR